MIGKPGYTACMIKIRTNISPQHRAANHILMPEIESAYARTSGGPMTDDARRAAFDKAIELAEQVEKGA